MAAFPCASIMPVGVTVDAELGGFLEVDTLGEMFLWLGLKMDCSMQDLIL